MEVLIIDKNTKLSIDQLKRKWDRLEFHGDTTLDLLVRVVQYFSGIESEIVVLGRIFPGEILIKDNLLSKDKKEE